jgi:hypothetical protein
VRIIFTIFLAALLTAPLARADKKFPMASGDAAPAATGNVSVDTDDNGNSKIKVNVDHLANPASLSPAETTYVVWIQQRGAQPQNAGVIQVNKDLKGEFETTTPSRSFDVFVTAEANRNATAPSGSTVLKATVQR